MMRTLLLKLKLRFGRTRSVRMQLKSNQGAIDGILLGVFGIRKQHYVMVNAWFYEHRPNAQGEELLGTVYLPTEEVLLFQERDKPYGQAPWLP